MVALLLLAVALAVLLLAGRWISGSLLAISFVGLLYLGFLLLGGFMWWLQTSEAAVAAFLLGAMAFYVAGMGLAAAVAPARRRKDEGEDEGHRLNARERLTGVQLRCGLDPTVMLIALLVLIGVGAGTSAWHVVQAGVPLLAGTWYTAGLEATTGLGRLVYSAGIDALLVWALIGLGSFWATSDRRFFLLGGAAFLLHLTGVLLYGGKGAAIFPFLTILFAAFYAQGRVRPVTLAAAGAGMLASAAFLGLYLPGGDGFVRMTGVYLTRLTLIPAEDLAFLLSEWGHARPFEFGRTVLLEVDRIASHLLPIERQPLFNQVVANAKLSRPENFATLLSPELNAAGIGYANFGLVGAMVVALTWGLLLETMSRFLLRRRSMEVLPFVALILLCMAALAAIRTGNVLISLESWAIRLAVPVALLAGVVLLVGGTMPARLVWRRRVPTVHEGQPAAGDRRSR